VQGKGENTLFTNAILPLGGFDDEECLRLSVQIFVNEVDDDMKFEEESIGARILETIASGLYDGNPNCLREYVQNGIDAGAKKIDIYFENADDDLVARG